MGGRMTVSTPLQTPMPFQSQLKARAFLNAQFQTYVVFSYLQQSNAMLM